MTAVSSASLSDSVSQNPNCPLCATPGGDWVFNCSKFRVIEAVDADYPGFLRLVWNDHVLEFSYLSREDRMLCMDAVVLVPMARAGFSTSTRGSLAVRVNSASAEMRKPGEIAPPT